MHQAEQAILQAREMELLEGTPEDPDAYQLSTDTIIRNLIGDERMYSDHYVRTVRHLSASIADDHDDPTLFGYTHPIDPGVVARAYVGHDVPTSVTNAEGRNDYEGEHG